MAHLETRVAPDLREPAKAQIYAMDLGRTSVAHMARTLVVRVANTATLLPTIRRAIVATEPNLPYVQVQPMQALVDPAFRSWELGATMFSMFGALALLLSAIGLFGSLNSAIDERKQEFAIRIALGASPTAIWSLTVRRMVILIAAGLATGFLALRWAAPTLQSLLFGIQGLDVRVLAVSLVTVVVSAAIACYAPLARAGRVDPINALRSI